MSVIGPEAREALCASLRSLGAPADDAALTADLAIHAAESAIEAFLRVVQSAPNNAVLGSASQIGSQILGGWCAAFPDTLLSQAHRRGQHTSFAEAEAGK